MRVDVVLVPVSVQMGAVVGHLRVVGFREADTWARRPVKSSATEAVRSLIDELPAEYRFVVAKLGVEPAGIDFTEELEGGAKLTLVYSIALPAPLADPDLPGAERWAPLLEVGGSQAQASRVGSDLLSDEPFGERLVEYWREELEVETRLFAFLPRYFTARQARDVYTAFWGYEQDAEGFAKWSGIGQNKKGGVYSAHIASCDLREGDLLRSQVDAVLAADTADVLGGQVGATLLCEAASRRAVGLWPRASAVGSATEAALAPLAAAASLVAYQRTSRGPKPTWYQRKADELVQEQLEYLYAPRAVWVFPPRDPQRAS